MSGDSLDLELATTALLADNRDVRVLLQLLARQLAGTLGPRVEVERARGLVKKSDDVKSLKVTVRSDQFIAEVDRHGQVTMTIGHGSGGIRIRTETVGTEEWLSRLLQELQKEATSNQASRLAIENLVMGGGL